MPLDRRRTLRGGPPSGVVDLAIVRDSFNRADTSNGLGSADSGQTWVQGYGSWGISSGKAYETWGLDRARCTLQNCFPSDDHWAEVVFSGADYNCTPCLEVRGATDASTGYLLAGDPGVSGLSLYKYVSWSLTAVIAPITTFTNGDKVKIECRGSTGNFITVWKNDAVVWNGGDASPITTGKSLSLFKFAYGGTTGQRWDDLRAGV